MEQQDQSLLAAFGWWEKRRIIYNLVVGTTGLFCIYGMGIPVFWFEIVLYGVLANICYCLGFCIEVAARFYFKNNTDFNEKRFYLYILGLVLSVIITFGLATLNGILSMPHPG
jgi:hypothetical protein